MPKSQEDRPENVGIRWRSNRHCAISTQSDAKACVASDNRGYDSGLVARSGPDGNTAFGRNDAPWQVAKS